MKTLEENKKIIVFFGLLLLIMVVIFVFLPGEIIEVLAEFIYGLINGMLICLLGAAICSTIF